MIRFILQFLFAVSCVSLSAQDSVNISESIDTVVISAPRIETALLRSVRSVSLIEPLRQYSSLQGISLSEQIAEVPGLMVMNSFNYAQDLRIAIRGFGARSAFGIRGIKLIVDGVPETTPDGQGQIDNLDLAIIENIEILRGGSSSLYGNASGGVINIKSLDHLDQSFTEIKSSIGAFSTFQVDAKAGLSFETSDFIVHVMHLNTEGYREQSNMQNTQISTRWIKSFSEDSRLILSANYTNSPTANDPGGLNIEEVEADRSGARTQNVIFDAGEAIEQFKVSGQFNTSLRSDIDFSTYAFYNTRDFYGLLPFEFGGIVDLKRDYFGQGSQLQLESFIGSNAVNKLMIGYDIAYQKDHRVRYNNLMGEQGLLNFNQNEIFGNVAGFLHNQLTFNKLMIDAGLRYDYNVLEAEDLDISNGDNSSSRILSAFNPSFGLNYRLNEHWSVFSSLSTSFETPSLSELSADPSGTEGFNQDLVAQQSFSKELGLRSQIAKDFMVELVAFHINTTDEIVPYEISQFPGRDFFRNAGESLRTGIEVSAQVPFSDRWTSQWSYTFSSMEYADYILDGNNLKGNRLPGLPNHRFTASSRYLSPSGFSIRSIFTYTGDMYLNDANSDRIDSFGLWNIDVSYPLTIQNVQLNIFGGVNNLSNTDYYDNVRINAFGKRYYEPGPPRYIFGGVKFRW